MLVYISRCPDDSFRFWPAFALVPIVFAGCLRTPSSIAPNQIESVEFVAVNKQLVIYSEPKVCNAIGEWFNAAIQQPSSDFSIDPPPMHNKVVLRLHSGVSVVFAINNCFGDGTEFSADQAGLVDCVTYVLYENDRYRVKVRPRALLGEIKGAKKTKKGTSLISSGTRTENGTSLISSE